MSLLAKKKLTTLHAESRLSTQSQQEQVPHQEGEGLFYGVGETPLPSFSSTEGMLTFRKLEHICGKNCSCPKLPTFIVLLWVYCSKSKLCQKLSFLVQQKGRRKKSRPLTCAIDKEDYIKRCAVFQVLLFR